MCLFLPCSCLVLVSTSLFGEFTSLVPMIFFFTFGADFKRSDQDLNKIRSRVLKVLVLFFSLEHTT